MVKNATIYKKSNTEVCFCCRHRSVDNISAIGGHEVSPLNQRYWDRSMFFLFYQCGKLMMRNTMYFRISSTLFDDLC